MFVERGEEGLVGVEGVEVAGLVWGEGGEEEEEREAERRGWVVMWVRTSWLVRVADWVSRIWREVNL